MSTIRDVDTPQNEASVKSMDWLSLDSSVFTSGAFLPEARAFHLRFTSGEVYRYFDFPPERYRDFLAAEQ